MPRSEARTVRIAKMPLGLSLGEAIAILLAAALLLFAVSQYFSSLKPEQERLRALEAELDAQQRSIIANAKPGMTEAIVEDQAKIALETLETFKSTHLKPFSSGRIALIKEINALAKKNGVTLTSGIDMGANLVESDADGDKEGANNGTTARKKSADLLNAFPSVGFRFTVFGQYSNVRTFITALEHEKQFVVINSINLTNQEARTSSRRVRGGEGASGIMVTIEMSAYFQPI
ncbi:MAG TPA: hypothetical protein VLG74_08480 [Blastocatellia bacterium]|nr:hypothetical protein [Blastocatellia bacterium]